MTEIEQRLQEETEKWLEKIEDEIKNSKIDRKDENVVSVMSLVKSYIKDSKYFLKNNQFIESFEAVIYAYGLWDGLKYK